jgi:hypothetical protein
MFTYARLLNSVLPGLADPAQTAHMLCLLWLQVCKMTRDCWNTSCLYYTLDSSVEVFPLTKNEG